MENHKKYHFEKLTPNENGDIHVYESAIDFVFEHDDIRNVAISGAYGAGKSSVLLSYQKNLKGEKAPKFLHISLAHFRNDTTDAAQSSNDNKTARNPIDDEENVLEGKILNQLIHQIPSEKIPQTNFRVKKSTNTKNIWKATGLIAAFVLICLHIFYFDEWRSFVSSLPLGCIRNILRTTTRPYARLVSGGLAFVCGFIVLFQLIKAQRNKNLFKRLNIQGNEIEIFEESKDSYFDKYLNEVLYLFENVDADVIVFEDMDRFEVNRIFERLREVNTLANIQRKKEGKSVLRFFYLLRDDIFISKDRTKFFDYIVPVIPVVDSSNSYNQFIAHLKKNNLFEKFDEHFLQGISLYVDDMRLLKNICNEFLIYFNRLNTTELDYNKMLALIVYKNLFPRDFSDLQLNRGFVFSLFDSKTTFVQNEVELLEQKIDELQQRITMSEDELTISKSELDTIFDKKRNYYGMLAQKDRDEYDRRLQALEDKSIDKRQMIHDSITAVRARIQYVKNASLANIITRQNIDKIFSLTTTNEIGVENDYRDIKGSEYFDLVKYLIRDGYIDETYADYMTYFYEDSLSRIDKVFLRSVSDKRAKEHTYELSSPARVLQYLRPLDFDQEEILNFRLCDYLLGQKNTQEHLNHLIDQLQKNKELTFVTQFFDRTQHIAQFVRIFNEQWPGLFADMQMASAFNKDQEKRYTLYSLYYCDDSVIQAIDNGSVFSSYISNSPDYLEIDNPRTEKLISGFRVLGVCFSAIAYERANKELFQGVYENDLYVLNLENLSMILINVLGVGNIEDVKHRSYSTIAANPESPICVRIGRDFATYFEILMNSCEGQIRDDESAAILLLNRSDLDVLQKQRYIKCLETQITKLKDLTDHSIWEAMMSQGVLLCSEENIMAYFQDKKTLDDTLIAFINESEAAFDFSEKHTGFTDKQRDELWDQVIICNELDDDKYAQILTTLDFYYDDFSLQGIANSKMSILIDKNIIRMAVDTLSFIRKEYLAVLFQFIRKNISSYVEMMTNDLFSHSELVEILDWDIPDTLKLKLLEFDDEPISVVSKHYSSEVQAYILQNNLMSEDLLMLYSSYDCCPDKIKPIVESYAAEQIERIIPAIQSIPKSLIRFLLGASNVATVDKADLIVAMMPMISLSEACRYLSSIGFDEYQRILDSHSRPRFEMDDNNKKILDAFVEHKWIFDYLEDESKPGFYRIRRKEPKKA